MKTKLDIKQIYLRKFKDTLPDKNMKDGTTLYELLQVIESHENVDKYLFFDNPNSLIRKRVIATLCEEFGLEYEYVYAQLKLCKRQ